MSCLCVTEDRAAFLPWLLWCFDRQTWPRKELVIVDSSLAPQALGERADVRVVRAPHRSRVAEKRNLALREARGELLAWFDDDDWQHPERLSVLVPALAPGITHAGPASSWFLDLPARHCERYVGPEQPIFNGALFRTSAAAALEFDTSRARAADTYWMRKLAAHGAYRVTPEPLFFWLSHARNLSNPRTRVRCTLPEATLREALGPAWADTDAELERLRARLADEPRATAKPASVVRAGSGLPRIVSAWNDRTPLPEPPRELARAARETRFVVPAPDWRPPPVSALVKATILDAPYLGAIVPHMLAQAKCRFAERLVIVDPRPEFSGKYRDRPRGTRALLDAVLSKLVREGHVDRVLEVSSERETVERVMSAYFGPEGGALPTYAASGGPIFPTLFGLESVATDHVLQMDADMFFHADGVGWVDEGLKLLTDPSIWLVMSQAGPPAGPVGSRASLGRKNARRARWDGERGVWKFTTASTRYFLTDRRRLRGNVPVVWHAPGELVPLEQCLGAGLQRTGTFRVNLAREGSWDLHAHYHGDPFPLWAERIAALVERGVVPPLQRGDYDLRLDGAASREAWRALLEAAPSAPRAPAAPVAASTSPERRAESAPLSVVIAIRDRAGARVRNALASLSWQQPRPAEVIVVSQGSRGEIDAELRAICAEAGARLLVTGRLEDPWCKPLALNVGIRATNEHSRYVMTMDADMILAPNFLGVVVEALSREPRAFVMCQISDLGRMTRVPGAPRALEEALPRLRRRSRLRGVHGSGAIQAARREFFFEVRGYDEDMIWWGAEDGDMVARAERSGMSIEWVTGRTYMLHQWHPKRHSHLTDTALRREASRAWERNHQLARERTSIARNPLAWGGAP